MSIHTRGLHRDVRPYADYALQIANYYRVPVTVTSVYRDLTTQARLRRAYETCVAQGRFPGPGCRYPANRPGDSAHNFGLAWDSVTEPQYQDWWDAVRQWIGFRVPPNDRIHAEVPDWRGLV